MRDMTVTTPLPQFLPYPVFLLDVSLSETAKLVYCLILCRLRLSQRNGWVDEQNRVYCRYPIKPSPPMPAKARPPSSTPLPSWTGRTCCTGPGAGQGMPTNCTSECRKPVPLNAGNLNLRMPENRHLIRITKRITNPITIQIRIFIKETAYDAFGNNSQ